MALRNAQNANNMKKTILILFFIATVVSTYGQLSFDERNWVIGRYSGTVKKTSPTIMCPAGIDITKKTADTSHIVVLDSSSCIQPSWSLVSFCNYLEVYTDSTLRGGNIIYGRLYSTDSLHLDFPIGGAFPYNMSYRMLKVKSYYITAGINELKNTENNILIYPNPCSEKLFVKNIAYTEIKKYSLLSIEGKEISFKAIGKEEFDVSDLPAGLYFLQLQTKEGVLTKKIVISR